VKDQCRPPIDGKDNAGGVVTFHELGADRTRILVQMDWALEGVKEKLGASLGRSAPHQKATSSASRSSSSCTARSRRRVHWPARFPPPREGATVSVLQRKELEESPLADLHAIASELSAPLVSLAGASSSEESG